MSAKVLATPTESRNRSIDGLRAFAALGVIASHTIGPNGTLPGNRGWVHFVAILGSPAVWLFFMISGYVLYRPFVRARLAGTGGNGSARWLTRRMLRLGPAYWVALYLGSVYPGLPGTFGPHWWAYPSLLTVYSDHTLEGGIGVSWTLCAEVAFAFFVCVWTAGWTAAAQRGRYRVRYEVLGLAALGLMSVVFRSGLLIHNSSTASGALSSVALIRDFTFPGQFGWFAAGMVLAAVSCREGHWPLARWHPVLRSWATTPLAAGLALVVIPGGLLVGVGFSSLAVNYGGRYHYPLEISVLTLAVFVPLAYLVLSPTSTSVGRLVLENPIIAWLGRVSFSLYLWHIAVLTVVGRHDGLLIKIGNQPLRYAVVYAIVVSITAVVATVSYWCVERPFIALGRRVTAPRQPTVAVTPTGRDVLAPNL